MRYHEKNHQRVMPYQCPCIEFSILRSKVEDMMDAIVLLQKEEMEYASKRAQKRRLKSQLFQLREEDEEYLELPTKKIRRKYKDVDTLRVTNQDYIQVPISMRKTKCQIAI
eukprot:1732995-Ditylum_brightwellii.AAC.1